MAIERLPALSPQPAPPPARDSRAAAQAAFFQAALGQVGAPAAPRHAEAYTAQAPQPTAPVQQEAAPSRTYRPGSILDIRV